MPGRFFKKRDVDLAPVHIHIFFCKVPRVQRTEITTFVLSGVAGDGGPPGKLCVSNTVCVL